MEQKYVMAAIDAALKAGEKILSIYNDPASDFQIEKKADNSPLTIADRKAHENHCRISKEYPLPIIERRRKAFILCREKVRGTLYGLWILWTERRSS